MNRKKILFTCKLQKRDVVVAVVRFVGGTVELQRPVGFGMYSNKKVGIWVQGQFQPQVRPVLHAEHEDDHDGVGTKVSDQGTHRKGIF